MSMNLPKIGIIIAREYGHEESVLFENRSGVK